MKGKEDVIYVCMYVYICVCVCIYIYIYINGILFIHKKTMMFCHLKQSGWI